MACIGAAVVDLAELDAVWVGLCLVACIDEIEEVNVIRRYRETINVECTGTLR